MNIRKIEVANFKSFENLDIELGKFNVLIGANASGKSNFVSIFQFLRDIASSGLDNAISMQGGVEYLRNMNIGVDKNLSIKVVSTQEGWFISPIIEKLIGIKTYETIYEFSLKFNKKGSGFRIVKDRLTQKCRFLRLEKKRGRLKKRKPLAMEKLLSHIVTGK